MNKERMRHLPLCLTLLPSAFVMRLLLLSFEGVIYSNCTALLTRRYHVVWVDNVVVDGAACQQNSGTGLT